MVLIVIFGIQVITFLLLYPLLLTGKRADEEMLMLLEENGVDVYRKWMEDEQMESQREVLRMIEREIKNGSAPVQFIGMEVSEETYHLVESQVKMNQLLDYCFKLGEFAASAGKQIKSNMYMDAFGRKPTFRSTKSELDRRNMEATAKRCIKKKHPSFDGDVYVENICCYLELTERIEDKQCTVNGESVTALIFSKKHLTGLYLQCLMYRKEIAEIEECKVSTSENGERIFRLKDVDVLFQCLLMDQMKWENGKLSVPFCTVYQLLDRQNK